MNNRLDSMGIGKALELFPEQILTCYDQAYSSDIKKVTPKQIIISGMGGSSNAAKIIQGVYESELKIPLIVHNDYGLPKWVNSETLVIANSYSGNTEETLSGVKAAKESEASVIGISTGGKINDVIVDPKNTNPTGFPKSGLGISLGALIGVLSKIGVLSISKKELEFTLNELVETRKSWDAEYMARWVNGYMPVLFCGRPFIGALNAGRNAMCEISRNFTQFYDFPEVNHVLIEALQKPEGALKNRYIFFESDKLHQRVKVRYGITKQIFEEQGLDYKTYTLKSKSIIGQALELSHYCSWIGYYLSMIQNTDPGPEPWIIKLKESLSQPVH